MISRHGLTIIVHNTLLIALPTPRPHSSLSFKGERQPNDFALDAALLLDPALRSPRTRLTLPLSETRRSAR